MDEGEMKTTVMTKAREKEGERGCFPRAYVSCFSPFLPHSLTHFLAHSLTHFLPHSLTFFLTLFPVGMAVKSKNIPSSFLLFPFPHIFSLFLSFSFLFSFPSFFPIFSLYSIQFFTLEFSLSLSISFPFFLEREREVQSGKNPLVCSNVEKE